MNDKQFRIKNRYTGRIRIAEWDAEYLNLILYDQIISHTAYGENNPWRLFDTKEHTLNVITPKSKRDYYLNLNQLSRQIQKLEDEIKIIKGIKREIANNFIKSKITKIDYGRSETERKSNIRKGNSNDNSERSWKNYITVSSSV